MRITKIYKTNYNLDDKLEKNVYKDWFELADDDLTGCDMFQFLSILTRKFLTEFEVCCIMNEFNAWRNDKGSNYGY